MKSSIVGLVPARGGSKAIPGKNLALVAGRPLLAYTADAALAAGSLDKVLLSTDDERIAAAGRELGLEVPFLRPASFAEDDTPMLAVIQHSLDWCAVNGGEPDIVVLLQPTSPLRRATDIEAAIALMQRAAAETVVSVTTVPHRFVPNSLMVPRSDGALEPFSDAPMILQRQSKRTFFARNGPAVLAVRSSVIRQGKLYGTPTFGYEMDDESSIDIDEPDDLQLAEYYLLRRRGREI